MSKYIRKTRDVYEIQTNYDYYGGGYGWECENTELTWTDARRSYKEYRDNLPPHVGVRLVKKRERITDN